MNLESKKAAVFKHVDTELLKKLHRGDRRAILKRMKENGLTISMGTLDLYLQFLVVKPNQQKVQAIEKAINDVISERQHSSSNNL